MKKTILLICALFVTVLSFAQNDTMPPYLKTRLMPDFRLLTNDSTEFNQTMIDKNKITIIMLFNPECSHCQEQLDMLLSLPEVAQKTQIVMSSIEPLAKNKDFYNKNHLEKYPFIFMGRDFKYTLGTFYQPKTIPVLAFYNAEKQLIFSNQGDAKKKEVKKALAD